MTNLEEKRALQLLKSDPQAALHQLAELTNCGNVQCAMHIGKAYYYGLVVPQEMETAKFWFEKARVAGIIEGTFFLGLISYHGADFQRAESLFLEGCARGDPPSMRLLANLYIHLNRNTSEIRNLLEQAASKGNVRAERLLGHLLLTGKYGNHAYLLGLRLTLHSLYQAFLVSLKDRNDIQIR